MLAQNKDKKMKTKFFAIALASIMSVGCFFDSSKVEESIKRANLTIGTENVSALKRITIDETNKVLSKEVVQDSLFGEYEVVTIDWGSVSKKNYEWTYYLYATEGVVKLDSVTFDDSLMYVNKNIQGNLIENKINLTGDGVLPVKLINDSEIIAKDTFTRFHKESYDSNKTMIIYGTDTTTNLPTKLVVKFKVKQELASIDCVDSTCVFWNPNGSTKLTFDKTQNAYFTKDYIDIPKVAMNTKKDSFVVENNVPTSFEFVSMMISNVWASPVELGNANLIKQIRFTKLQIDGSSEYVGKLQTERFYAPAIFSDVDLYIRSKDVSWD